MYFVKYGSKYLHEPRTDDRVLTNLKFEGGENEASLCDFEISSMHPLYDELVERASAKFVKVFDDVLGEDNPYFVGYIYEMSDEFNRQRTVRCKGELSFFNDSIVRPYTTQGNVEVDADPGGYFEWLVTQHNSQVESAKRFTLGHIQTSGLDSNNYILRSDSTYPTTGEVIKDKLLDKLGGVLRVRYENGKRYIDYLTEWSDVNTQVFDFGVNLTDFVKTDDALDVATFVVPIGADMKDTDYKYNDGYFKTSDSKPSSKKTYYTKTDSGYSQQSKLEKFEDGTTYYEYNKANDESQRKLTIAGMSDLDYSSDIIKTNDYIYSKSAVEKYGWIGAVYDNKDITVRENLLDAGVIALKEALSPVTTIEIKAVDLSLINPKHKPIRVGEYVRVRCKPHNFDSYMLCTAVDLNLNNPEDSEYTLGTTFDKLSGQQNKRIKALNKTIEQVYVDAASISDEAKAAALLAAEANEKAYSIKSTATLSIESTNGSSFDSDVNDTTLVAHIFEGDVELTEEQIAESGASVTWYADGVEYASGMSVTVGKDDFDTKTTLVAQLEVQE